MAKFAILAEREQTRPIAMVDIGQAIVYIAESFHLVHEDHDGPGWKLVYAIARGDADAWNTIWCKPLTSQNQRIAAACEFAREFVDINLEVGRYVN
ncbi:MAG: hypothetical protein ACR2QF_09530 [Geminicoccaceae bacterium]